MRNATAKRALQKDRTRARILEAARLAFASSGYHRTLVDDVAREAGVSKGAVYVHFPSKEDLFLALLDDSAATLAERVVSAIASARGARGRVEAALQAALGAFEENEALTRLLLLESVGLSPQVERRRWELRCALAALIQGYLDEAVAEGDIPPQDTALAAAAWLGAVSEVVLRWLHERRPSLGETVPALTALLLRSAGFREV